MANRQKSHFGKDGYKELYLKEEAAKKTGTKNDYFTKRRLAKQKELHEFRSEENKIKTRSTRAGKTIVPKGTGKKIRGDYR